MSKNNKILIGIISTLCFVIVLGIAYAAFTQNLNVTGTANVRDSKWKVYFSRISDSATTTGTATVSGYKARLAKIEELRPIGWSSCASTATFCSKENVTPNWVWNSKYWYWTMSKWNGSDSRVWDVSNTGILDSSGVSIGDPAVRPVVNIYKSSIQS